MDHVDEPRIRWTSWAIGTTNLFRRGCLVGIEIWVPNHIRIIKILVIRWIRICKLFNLWIYSNRRSEYFELDVILWKYFIHIKLKIFKFFLVKNSSKILIFIYISQTILSYEMNFGTFESFSNIKFQQHLSDSQLRLPIFMNTLKIR